MYTICTILVFKIAKHAISTLAPRRKKRINRRKAKGGHSEQELQEVRKFPSGIFRK